MSKFTYFLHQARRLQENHNDVSIIVDGAKGVGKSTIVLQMIMEYLHMFSFICPFCKNEFYKNCYRMEKKDTGTIFYIPEEIKNGRVWIRCPEHFELDMKTGQKIKTSGCGKIFQYKDRKRIKFEAERFVAYDNSDAYNKLLTLPIESPIDFDEAFNFMGAQDFNKTESKELKKLITVCRPKRRLMFYVIPEITWLDSKYRDIISNYWFRLIDRGVCIIFEKDRGITKDKYHLKELEDSIGVIKTFTPLDKIRMKFKKHPCYFDTWTFNELDEKVYDDYEMVRNAKNLQRQVEEQQLSNKDMAKVMAWNLLREWDAININVQRSRELKMTFEILKRFVMKDPITSHTMASEQTIRNWVRGVDSYITSKGKDIAVLMGLI